MSLVAGMAGIRTATMYLTAEEIGRRKPQNTIWVLSGCLLYSILISFCIATAVYVFAPQIADYWIGNSTVTDVLRLFSAFLPVNCFCGVMIGYFTGANKIGTLAAVEITEQFCSMIITIILLQLWAKHDPVRSCHAVVLGSGIGACVTLACLVILRIRERGAIAQKIPLYSRLCHTAIPLAIADDLRTGISTLENLIVPKRLALFPGSGSPLADFGTVCGMVFPILTFPMALLFGLTELLIPELARCNAAGSKERIEYLVKRSLRIALIFGAVCTAILYLIAEPLCERLYPATNAGKYLKWFAPLAIMLYCDAVTDAMIKGLGQQKASVRYNILTNSMDVTFLYLLLPHYGIWGYFISFTVTHVINFFLSIRRLLQISEIKISIKYAVFSIISVGITIITCSFLNNTAIKVFAAAIIMCCLFTLFGITGKEDLYWILRLIRNKK